MPGQGLLALDGGYVQSHDNPEGMEGKVAAESGVAQAESLVVLGDGASWITEIAAWHFPQVKRQLDLWHLLRRGHRPSWGKTWPRLLDPPPYWCIHEKSVMVVKRPFCVIGLSALVPAVDVRLGDLWFGPPGWMTFVTMLCRIQPLRSPPDARGRRPNHRLSL